MAFETVEKVREFLRKFPPQSEDFKIFGSTVLAHLEDKEQEIVKLRKEIAGLGVALKAVAELIIGQDEQEVSAEASPEVQSQPFPEGVKWQPETAAAPDQAVSAEEIPQPDVVSRTTSVAPIPPNVKAQNNGAKA